MLVPALLLFTTAYLVLRNTQPAHANPKPPKAQRAANEQVTTISVRKRMGDAIGTGAAIGVTRAQMAHTQRDAEADIHVSGTLRATKPPKLELVSAKLPRARGGAPGQAAPYLRLDDALCGDDRAAETVARAERAAIFRRNAPIAHTARPARLLNLETMHLPQPSGAHFATRTVGEAQPLIDTLPADALGHDATVRMAEMTSVTAEPGDMVQLAALAARAA